MARRAHGFRRLIQRWQSAISAVESCAKPVISVVHGACIGAGVDLITASDVRVCSDDAKFSVREVAIGLAADLGSLQRLTKVIGNVIILMRV